jgi:hypothetical protein
MKKTNKKSLPKQLIIETDYPSFTVLILGMPWEVRFLNKEQTLKEHQADIKGVTIYSEYTIDLLYEGSLLVLEATWWHEFAHAATSHTIGSTDDKENLIDSETLANCVGDALFQLLRQDFLFHPKYSDKQKAKLIRDLLQAEYV